MVTRYGLRVVSADCLPQGRERATARHGVPKQSRGGVKPPPPGEGVGGEAKLQGSVLVPCPPSTAAKLATLVKPRCPPPRGGGGSCSSQGGGI